MKRRDRNGKFAYKGERIMLKGYPVVYAPEHHRAKSNGYVREHIVVAEKCLGRALADGEVIHHINEDKKDNRPENLVVFKSHSDHMKYHWMLRNPDKYNGIALPPALYCMQGIAEALSDEHLNGCAR